MELTQLHHALAAHIGRDHAHAWVIFAQQDALFVTPEIRGAYLWKQWFKGGNLAIQSDQTMRQSRLSNGNHRHAP